MAPRVAQAAMRHSTIDLTMNTYTDPRLLDVHGALEVLPSLPLDGGDTENQRATGTNGGGEPAKPALAPVLAPKLDKSGKSRSTGDNGAAAWPDTSGKPPVDVSAFRVKRKDPLSTADNGSHPVERKRFELSTSALRTQQVFL